MVELIRTHDMVLVAWLEMRLAEQGIKSVVLDRFTGSAYGFALDAVQPRVMVDEADLPRSRRILESARERASHP